MEQNNPPTDQHDADNEGVPAFAQPSADSFSANDFVTTVSAAWGRAIFLSALGAVFVIFFLVAGPQQWLGLLEHPLYNPLASAGFLMLVAFAIYLPYIGLSMLFQKLIIHDDTIVLKRLFVTKSLELSQLDRVTSKVVSNRSGVQTFLYLFDHAGKKIKIPVHFYKKEPQLAQLILAASERQRAAVDGDTRQVLTELAGSAHSGSLAPVVASDRMMIKQLKAVLILGAVVLPFLIGFSIYQSSHGEVETPADHAASSKVANEFLQDLGSENINAAIALESPHLKATASHIEYLRATNFRGIQSSVQIDDRAGTTSNKPYYAYVYRNNTEQTPYYIKIILSKYDNDWRVWFYQSSPEPLHA